ncbi:MULTISPECIES: NETI motif-containing protein [Bacillaceae]|uniref:NETI motif-containing protein n=1 Tax=Bacillaceae TaxID=186817 RepID=UPI00047C57A9|nr:MULTISPECIES: NETI motif-containing protein [Bacillaceae]UOE94474.1 NETI motif-containing protein [Alkalihalobacillus sp. LMS39]
MSKKKKFYLEEDETIDSCLKRMDDEGYTPVRRTEEPVFQEVKNSGQTEYIPIRQKIVFEGVIKENHS